MVYFSRNKALLKDVNADIFLKIRDQSINSSFEVKILGVILNAGLLYYSHVASACKGGTNSYYLFNRLKMFGQKQHASCLPQ